MKKFVAIIAAMAFTGCGNVCSKFKTLSERCGGTWNEASCNVALDSCSSDDEAIMSDMADCLGKETVCNHGKVVDDAKAASCVLAAKGMSTACGNALGGR